MHCCLFATLKEVFADNDLWLQNTCHDAVLIGHEAGKKGEEEKKEVKKRVGGRIKHARDVKIALQIQHELTSTNEILYFLTLSFYLKQGIQDSTD
jgi:hypothetical protein